MHRFSYVETTITLCCLRPLLVVIVCLWLSLVVIGCHWLSLVVIGCLLLQGPMEKKPSQLPLFSSQPSLDQNGGNGTGPRDVIKKPETAKDGKKRKRKEKMNDLKAEMEMVSDAFRIVANAISRALSLKISGVHYLCCF